MPKRQDPSDPTGLPYDFRIDRANFQRSQADVVQTRNNDRQLMVDRGGTFYRTAMFSKTLPHNAFGEVTDDDFVRVEVALRSGDQQLFDRIVRATGAVRRLADPQAALAFSLSGADAYSVSMPEAPSMTSSQAAGEMIEVYGMALLRDQSFRDIQNGTTSMEAEVTTLLADLNQPGLVFLGPKDGGVVTRGTLFRGPNPGETIGPYVSQFLLHDVVHAGITTEQFIAVEDDDAPSITTSGWLDIQNGIVPGGQNLAGFTRRAYSPRVIGSYVHTDVPGCAFLNAAFILLGAGAPMNPGTPVLANEEFFVNFWIGEFATRVLHVAHLALKAAWRQKWVEHVRLRPEVYAGRVHFTLDGGETYNLDNAVLTAGTTANVLAANTLAGSATYLLPLMYPEGSPTHPSYPAGHATIAGACATLLKAFFDGDALMQDLSGGTFPIIESVTGTETMGDLVSGAITDPAVVDNLTVAIELNKLASNIATARNMAGVHYRSDGDQGVLLGEKVALQYLKDVAANYNERSPTFDGFQVRKFDGTLEIVTPSS
jgi:hypothetical protein